MNQWNMPPVAKVYEALSAVADGRVKLTGETSAEVLSSERDKTYAVRWSPDGTRITSNDNATRWQGYLGYPIIAVLLLMERIPYDPDLARSLAAVPWHELNNRFKRDYDAAVAHVLAEAGQAGADVDALRAEVERIFAALGELNLGKMSSK